MRYYPLFMDLQDAACLVVGAGSVGLRKAAALLEYPVRELQIVDPLISGLPWWSTDPRIIVNKRNFTANDLKGKQLVFAATANQRLNDRIAGLCAKKGILCNTVTGREGSFLVPAVAQSGPIQVAVTTSGASPALSKFLKQELVSWLNCGYGSLAVLLEELRPLVINLGLPQSQNAHLFNLLCEKDSIERLLQPLREKNCADLQTALQGLLPPDIHTKLAPLASKVINRISNADVQ